MPSTRWHCRTSTSSSRQPCIQCLEPGRCFAVVTVKASDASSCDCLSALARVPCHFWPVSVQHTCMTGALQAPRLLQVPSAALKCQRTVQLPGLQGCSPDTPATVLQQFICVCCSREVGVLCVFRRTFPSEGPASTCQWPTQAANTLGLPHGCCCLRLMCCDCLSRAHGLLIPSKPHSHGDSMAETQGTHNSCRTAPTVLLMLGGTRLALNTTSNQYCYLMIWRAAHKTGLLAPAADVKGPSPPSTTVVQQIPKGPLLDERRLL